MSQGVAFMCFLHLYMGYTQPLFIQAIMTLKGVLECVPPAQCCRTFQLIGNMIYRSKPAMLHLWGKKAEGDLSRPFKTGGGLLESLSKCHSTSEGCELHC